VLIVHAVLPIAPEHREAFLEAVGGLVEATRAEPGVLEYGLHESVEQPGTFTMVERYVDAAAFDAHLASAHFQAAAGGLGDWLAGPPQITKYEAQEGEPVALG
jgi:quinol monooxygenase YgiN